MFEDNRKILLFLKEQKHPFTTDQIADRLGIPPHELSRTLCRLQSLGFLNVEFISPGYSMVIPKYRFFSMGEQQMDDLCKTVTSMECASSP